MKARKASSNFSENGGWFTASLLFKAEHSGVPNWKAIWEEQIVLFQALNDSDAKAKATTYGRSHQHEYTNDEGKLVRWSFQRIERVCEIDTTTLIDGTEVFSRFLRDSEVKSLSVPFED
jgi:hypothetical protein